MVCTGNICRSPTAHGVMRHLLAQQGLADQVQVDSCGTHDYHVGEPSDRRSQKHALRRGYDLSDLRARQVGAADFERFDLILAMDAHNLSLLRQRCPAAQQHKLHLLTEYCSRHANTGVPDPYYGGDAGFEQVLDLVEDACEGVLRALPR
ncbi:MAG: low molecular weight protein-tyrosine-phosphatase [Comamonas sp.]